MMSIWLTVVLLIGASAKEQDCYGAAVEIKVSRSSFKRGDEITSAVYPVVYGYPASFGTAISPTPSKEYTLKIANPEHACHKLEDSIMIDKKSRSGQAVLVQRGGNCSFLAKARNAQAAGYEAMLMYDPMSDDCIFMASDETQEEEKDVTLLAASITATAAKKLIDNIDSTVTFAQPEQSVFDLSEVALFLIAVSAVAGGSIWAGKEGISDTTTASGGQEGSRESEGIEVISVRAAASFIFLASAVLVAMFFLLSKWLAFVITGLFSIIAWQASTITTASLLCSFCPATWGRYKTHTPCTGSILLLDLVALCTSTLITTAWLILVFYFHNHTSWTLQNVLCFSLVLLIFKTLQLPNLKVSAILLVSAMVYDVWWVFLQPIVVGGPSVMVEVATGGGGGFRLPIAFAIPRYSALGTNPSLAMLGLGDVVLPGLLVAMARRWDVAAGKQEEIDRLDVTESSAANAAADAPTTTIHSSTTTSARRSGFYFFPMVVAYSFGLLTTFAALAFGWGGDQGQPALLYLVPCTLGMLCLLGWIRGELSALWHWQEKEDQGEGREARRNRRRGDREDVEQGAPLLSHPVAVT
ncbi:hypothetical protein Ndes2526B_g01296 [Nannochloris sp. 'desiccata']|nr:putative Signal peptide peptidase-like 2 [Chlorella desiccata (nom. nud.)]